MSVVTLSPAYVTKLAQSYRLLRKGEYAEPHVLETLRAASERCINAHMRAELRLTPDVRLPLGAVCMMLGYVHHTTTELLTPVPTPEDLAPSEPTPVGRSFLRRMLERLHERVAA